MRAREEDPMRIKSIAKVAAPAVGLAAVVVASTISVATGEPPPEANGCATGFHPRNARPGDDLCVSRDFARRTAQENAEPSANKEPNGGAYGPATCLPGFVWREAFDGDTICVTPDIRAQNLAANKKPDANRSSGSGTTTANAPQPTPVGSPQPQAGSVVMEVFGPGSVYTIDADPGPTPRPQDVKLPWKGTFQATPRSGQLIQVVAIGKDSPGPGCRITLNGKVVAEEPIGGDAHCEFAVP